MSGPTNAHININNFREKNNIHIWPSTIMQKLFPNFQPKKRKFWQLMSPTPYMLQCASNGKWFPLSCSGGGIGSGPGQEVFELVRFYLLMLCSGTQPSARQAGGTIRCTVLFLMGSLPQSRFRFLHQRAHPPPVRQPFSQAQPSANARLARSPKKFPKRSPICCPQDGRMILSGGQFLKDWPFGK